MKKLIFLLLILFLITSCSIFKSFKKEVHFQTQYLPEQFQDLYLNMPFSEFEKTRNINKMERSDIMSFRISYEEHNPENNINNVTYYIDNEGNLPLYELIIEYNQNFDLTNYIKNKYGSPNFGTEWLYDSKEGFMIKIWTFDNKLVIAGAIKGTEWNN